MLHFEWGKFFFQTENDLISNKLLFLTLIWLTVGLVSLYPTRQKILLIILFFSLFPFLPIFSKTNVEIKNRLFLMSFILSSIIFILSLPHIHNKILRNGLLTLSSIFLLINLKPYLNKNTPLFPLAQHWSIQIENLDQLTTIVLPQEELITHHGLQFYVDYKTPIRARSLIAKNRQPQYQIAYVPPFYYLNPTLADEIKQIELLSLGANYGLFKFNEFQQLMRLYPILRHWKNEFPERPDFVSDY